ncbi:MAG TPA: DUF5916 domain-containing protein [Thermoanaerobaculia bacterium]|nr:DUF5916 domain-containing protein [Thermoanaerobaculia bacterium]
MPSLRSFPVALCLVAFVTPLCAATPAIPPPLVVKRTAGKITIDGKLDDGGWRGAAKIDRFFETFPGDNTPPKVKTVAYLTYDGHYFYIGIHAYDPHPDQIRAPYVERDNIVGTDDNVAVFLDTRNDRRAAIELRVNPRGNQADAVYNDATGNEDFSPDFFYDTAARITSDGWTAEYRIPFSSLRYEKSSKIAWGILIWRNYPRDQRYFLHSSPIPRGSNCWICQARELTGFTDLPSGGHFVATPYLTGRHEATPKAGPGSTLSYGSPKIDGGIDFKWTPNANNAVDATINPDFSQVESDVGQIAVNNQFALFYPEKRTFFLESVDLFDTPIQAVYTRTITDPSWGLRDTGKIGGNTFTVLAAHDRGGGSVIVPGPIGSTLARQDFSSNILIGRLRHDFAGSFGGLLLAASEIAGGGYNRVFGPDFVWHRSVTDQVTGQLLVSDTETPDRPDLEPSWNGRRLTSHAASFEWLHTGRTWTWRATYQDYGDDFRADEGYVPQVGYRRGRYALVRSYYPTGGVRRVNVEGFVNYVHDTNGGLLHRETTALVQLQGFHNLFAQVLYAPSEATRVGNQVLTISYAQINFEIDPGRRFSRIGFNATVGEQIDFSNPRIGRGGDFGLFGTIKPTDHLDLEVNGDRQWLDVRSGNREGRLFTAQIERLKATYNFNARTYLRLIGEYLAVERDPALYTDSVAAKGGSFSGSALFAYRLNWQTVFFVGYGDNRVRDPLGNFLATDRIAFVKLSYAIQR